MPDIDIHRTLRKCCRATLTAIDSKKKDARFERGLLALPLLDETFGTKPVDRARQLVPPSGTTFVGSADAVRLKYQEAVLKFCRALCEEHGNKHDRPGEKLEAAFWHELAAGLEGDLQKETPPREQANQTALATTPGPAGGKSKMDIDKAVEHLDAKANRSSTGLCGRYVHNAIVAGGVEMDSANAKDLGPKLEAAGFTPVATETNNGDYTLQAGDVVVFDKVPGHENGHAAMYDGEQWVSDYKQNDFFAAEPYKQGKYKIYRP